MERFAEWPFEGGPKSFYSRVGADGEPDPLSIRSV